MNKHTPFRPTLPVKRDNHILDFHYRMGIGTVPVLHRMFFPTRTLNAVSQVTTRLVKDGYLARHPLWHKSKYYTLGKRCIRLFDAPRRKTIPRGEQVLPVDLGTLLFCCSGEKIYKRLLPQELVSLFPWFPKQYSAQPFCMTNFDGKKRLAQIKVELTEYPHLILKKHRQQLHTFREIQPFRELIEQDGFMVITITTTPERREALLEEIKNDPWYPLAAVYDHPDLSNLL